MVSIQNVKAGMTRFVEQEVCSQLTGVQKFAVATAAGLAVARMDDALRKLPLGLSDGGNVDVDAIYKEASKNIETPVTVSVPLVGTFSFTRENLDTLYAMIKGA